MRQEDINNWFSYHAPNSDQLKAYTDIRNKAKELAEMFDTYCPDCADKTAAVRELRGTVMAMNLAIACYIPVKRPTIEELEKILNSEHDTPITVKPDGSITTESE